MAKTSGYGFYVCIVGLFLIIFGFGLGFIIGHFVIKYFTQTDDLQITIYNQNETLKVNSSSLMSFMSEINAENVRSDYRVYEKRCSSVVNKNNCIINYVYNKMVHLGLESVEKIQHKVLLQLCDIKRLNTFKLKNTEGITVFEIKFEHSSDSACAFSQNGQIAGSVIFVNHATETDFDMLKANNVEVDGKICIARLGELHPENMIKNAYKMGAKALLVYKEQGISNIYARNDQYTPEIVVQHITTEDAEKILHTLDGIRIKQWQFRFYVGPTFEKRFSEHVAEITINTKKEEKTITNLIAKIEGAEPDRYVVLGSQRSGENLNTPTITFLEIARILEIFKHKGWKPRRTIIFASFDAKEFGFLGLRKWLQKNFFDLSSKTVVYIDLDLCCQKEQFENIFAQQSLIEEVKRIIKKQSTSESTSFDKLVYSDYSDDTFYTSAAGIDSIDFNFKTIEESISATTDGENHFSYIILSLITDFIDSALIPVRPLDLANYIHNSFEVLKLSINKLHKYKIDLGELRVAVKQFQSRAMRFSNFLSTTNATDPLKLRIVNDQLNQMEKCFFVSQEMRNGLYTPSSKNTYVRGAFQEILNLVESFENNDDLQLATKKLKQCITEMIKRITDASKTLEILFL